MEPIYLVVIGVALGFLTTWFWRERAQIAEAQAKEKARVDALVADMSLIKMQFSPFWQGVEKKIISDLTHPSPQFKEMDELLRKLEVLIISEPERERLKVLLQQRIVTDDPEVSQDEKDSAQLMIGVMQKVRAEAALADE